MRKIAVSYNNGEVFHTCCKSPQIKIYSTRGDMLSKMEIVEVEHEGIEAFAELMQQHDIKVVICGKISDYMKKLLETNLHIEVHNGVKGDADSAVVAYLAGILDFDPVLLQQSPDPMHSCSGRGGDWNGID